MDLAPPPRRPTPPEPRIHSEIAESILENPGKWFLCMVIKSDAMRYGDRPATKDGSWRWMAAHSRVRKVFYGKQKRATFGLAAGR